MSNSSDSNIGREQEDSEGAKRCQPCFWKFVLKKWYLIIASVAFFLLMAFVYVWYASPQYEVYTKVLIKNQKTGYSSNAVYEGHAHRMEDAPEIDFGNEMEILATKTLNKKVVKALHLYVTYTVDGMLKRQEIERKASPYLVRVSDDMLDSLSVPVELTILPGEKGDKVQWKADEQTGELVFMSSPFYVPTPYGQIIVEKNPHGKPFDVGNGLKMVVRPLEEATWDFLSSLSVEASSSGTTVARITLADPFPQRATDYLNKLVEVYNEENHTENIIEATRTRDFIDERLTDISKDLNATDVELKQYKHNGMMANYKPDGTIDATQNVLHEQRLVEVGTQIDLINYLIEYCNDKHNELQIMPANIGLNDEELNALIAQYNEKIQERNRLLDAADTERVEALTKAVEDEFVVIRSSLQTAKNEAVSIRNELLGQQGGGGRGTAASSRGRALADINRLQEVKVGLYLMLLKKREENLLMLSTSADKAKQIEAPTVMGIVPPCKEEIYGGAALLGLLLPFLWYYMKKRQETES